MPRYFFDVQDGGLVRDQDGIEFADAAQARTEALQALPDLAKDLRKVEDGRRISVIVRDAAGRSICEATLSIDTRWLTDDT